MKIGSLIKSLRNNKGISAYRLALDSKISKAYISQLESGKSDNPSVDTLHKILKVLNITEEEFFRIRNDAVDVSIALIAGLTVSTWGLW